MSHEYDTPPSETRFEQFVTKDYLQTVMYQMVRVSTEWTNHLNDEEYEDPVLLLNLKDDVITLTNTFKMIFRRRKMAPGKEREAAELDVRIAQNLDNFSLLHNIEEAKVTREVPHADSTNLSSQLHELANSIGNIFTVASIPHSQLRNKAVARNIRAAKAMCRQVYTRIGPEALKAEAIPYDFSKLHDEILEQSAIKTGEIELIFKQEEFLEENKDLLLLLDPSDLPGFLMNIIQNLRRHYNVRDALAQQAKETGDKDYKDRETEPRILEIRYEYNKGDDYLSWNIIDHATGFPTRILQEERFPPNYTTVPDQGGQGLGMSYYQQRFSQVDILFGFADELYDFQGIKRRGSRLTVKIPVVKL